MRSKFKVPSPQTNTSNDFGGRARADLESYEVSREAREIIDGSTCCNNILEHLGKEQLPPQSGVWDQENHSLVAATRLIEKCLNIGLVRPVGRTWCFISM